jgi:hypothetical protein
MLNFKHVNLEKSVAVYNTHRIEVIQKTDKYWYIYVDSRKTDRGPFLARRFAILCVESTIARIEGTPLPKDFMTEVNGILDSRPKVNGRPKPKKFADDKPTKLVPFSPIRRNK